MFNKPKTIQEITKTQISEQHYKLIEQWKAIYAGNFDDWHNVVYHTLNGKKKRRMHSLKMAKVSTEELARLVFNERVLINISDKAFGDNIKEVLKDNRFYAMLQNKIEVMFALGGIVLKAHPEKQMDETYKLLIKYVTPDCFIPISYENGKITEAIFMNVTKKGDKTYCLLEFHLWDYRTIEGNKEKVYVIKNELYESDQHETQVKRVPLEMLYEDLEEQTVITGLKNNLYTYIAPNEANNFDLKSPLGISIYANALDTLYALDIAFDSFIREFRLGKRRIIVPATSVRTIVDPQSGEMQRYFDADDEVYQAFNFADPEKQKVMDNTVDLRVDEHISAINALLNLYAMQAGFSTGTFTFDGHTVKTATEVISEKSKTYQTVVSNEELLEEGLKNFIHTLGEVAALYDIFDLPEDYDIEFYWDDSIIKDKYTDSDFYIKLNQNGLISKKFALMKILDLTEEDAVNMIAEVKQESATENPDLNDIIDNGDLLGGVE